MARRPLLITPVDDHLAYWLRLVSSHASLALSKRCDPHGVTTAEWPMLRALYPRRPRAPSQVAESLGLTRGAITRLADRLIEKKLITRTGNPGDRRYQDLELTAEGAALVPTLSKLADKSDTDFFARLSDEDRHVIRNAMEMLVQPKGVRAPSTRS